MKTIIAGSRDIDNYQLVLDAISESGFQISHVVSGGARGVDALAERYARENEIPITIFYAQWKKYASFGQTKRAGHDRNKTMSENAEALIAVWNSESRGTASMIENAREKGLKIYVKKVEKSTVFKKLPKEYFGL